LPHVLGSALLEIWGKCHKELRVDTQFVRFPRFELRRLLTLKNICADRKELKMLTKGRCERTSHNRRRH